jgi:soluble lytic murein transglycosylase-like protein
MIAIIDTESDFDNTKISTTGDLSLAQINTDIWNKELKRLKLPSIDEKRLQNDESYALNQMAMILSILKERHSKKDGSWYARYHSHTKKYKTIYFSKVQLRMRKIASIN